MLCLSFTKFNVRLSFDTNLLFNYSIFIFVKILTFVLRKLNKQGYITGEGHFWGFVLSAKLLFLACLNRHFLGSALVHCGAGVNTMTVGSLHRYGLPLLALKRRRKQNCVRDRDVIDRTLQLRVSLITVSFFRFLSNCRIINVI